MTSRDTVRQDTGQSLAGRGGMIGGAPPVSAQIWTYAYDLNGNRVLAGEATHYGINICTRQHTYDGNDRLVAVSHTGCRTERRRGAACGSGRGWWRGSKQQTGRRDFRRVPQPAGEPVATW
ncbi:MAG: hypothetical protein KIT79_06865 [Deltaproteobacteria bacterium]|nr:hypothetical protein [Deltaproteobacteria bacterium]